MIADDTDEPTDPLRFRERTLNWFQSGEEYHLRKPGETGDVGDKGVSQEYLAKPKARDRTPLYLGMAVGVVGLLLLGGAVAAWLLR